MALGSVLQVLSVWVLESRVRDERLDPRKGAGGQQARGTEAHLRKLNSQAARLLLQQRESSLFRGLFKDPPLWDPQAARHGGRTTLGPPVVLGAPHCKHSCLPRGTGPVALNLQKPLLAPWAPSFLLRGGPTPLSSWGTQAMEQQDAVMKPLYVGSRGLAVPEQEQLLPWAQASYLLVQLCVCKQLGAPPRRTDSIDHVPFPQRWGVSKLPLDTPQSDSTPISLGLSKRGHRGLTPNQQGHSVAHQPLAAGTRGRGPPLPISPHSLPPPGS